VRLLSISIDPEFDRPEILKAYGAAVGADPAIWQFATGEKTEIARISADFAVFTERNGVTLDHTLCTALIDADGRVVELWRGSGWRADEVIAALVRAAAR
jgi:protein SCO1/2